MGQLKVGVGYTDITPPVGTPLEGYIERKGVSEGVHDSLFAKAVVLSDETGDKVAIVSLDLIGVSKWIVDFARQRTASETGIKVHNVMIAATHTHSGPRGVLDFFMGEQAFTQGVFNRSLSEQIGNAIANIVTKADNNLREAKIGFGRSNSIGLCSNRITPDGSFDPEIDVIRIDSAVGGGTMGCLVNYACHPTVLGPSNLLYSADFPSYLCDTVQSAMKKKLRKGDPAALYLNGAAANVSTRFTRKETSFAEAERIGRGLASEVLKSLQAVKRMNEDVVISTASEVITLPQRKLPPLDSVESNLKRSEELLKQLKTSGASQGDIRAVESLTEGARGLLAAYDYISKSEGRKFEAEIQVFKLGEAAILCAVPAELFVELGLEVRKNLQPNNALIVGYANGFIGYVLTEQAYHEGGYESLSTFLEPNAGTRIVKKIEEVAGRLVR